MLRAPLQWAFRKLGARYPRALVFLQLQTSHVVVFAGVLLLALYVHLSTGQFWRIVAVSQDVPRDADLDAPSIPLRWRLLGALPTWPYSAGWGYYPSSGLGLILLILIILLLVGRI